MRDVVLVKYLDGQAVAESSGRALVVERRNQEASEGLCPNELISVALGS